MEYQINKHNKIALFHDFDQSDEEETRMMCSFYAPAINLKYNCGIQLTEDDLKLIARKQMTLWDFDAVEGGSGSDGVKAVYDYVKENAEGRGWDIPNLATTKTDADLDKWIELGYAIIIGIKVNSEFYKDAIDDGKLNSFNDYLNYKGDLGHFTNVARWTGRNTESESNGNEFVIDSFFKHFNQATYECEIEEILEDIDMTTKYLFF